MTKQQAINYLYSCGMNKEQVDDVVKALEVVRTWKVDITNFSIVDDDGNKILFNL